MNGAPQAQTSWRIDYEYTQNQPAVWSDDDGQPGMLTDTALADYAGDASAQNRYVYADLDGAKNRCAEIVATGNECAGVTSYLDGGNLVFETRSGSATAEVGKTTYIFTTALRDEDVVKTEPWSQYVQSLYWSLTTMTTIGYGDRSPKTTEEYMFCMVCEIIGMSFFALLLTQINNLNEVLGKDQNTKNEIKNEVVGFISHNDLGSELVEDALKVLNFTSASVSAKSFDFDSHPFSGISRPLLRDIKIGVFSPPLKRVAFLGWSKDDHKEKDKVQRMFDKTDKDGGGSLDSSEIRGLVDSLGLPLSAEQLSGAMAEMDEAGTGEIPFESFEKWWFTKKNGKPRTPPAPVEFVNELAYVMKVNPASPKDVIQEEGHYGDTLYIVLTGCVDVMDTTELGQVKRAVEDSNREPLFGITAALPERTRASLRKHTEHLRTLASKFCDIGSVSRAEMLDLLDKHWNKIGDETGQGARVFMSIARNVYEPGTWEPNDDVLTGWDLESPVQRISSSGESASTIEQKVTLLEDRMTKQMESLRTKVETTLAGLDTKLDLLLS